MNVLITGATGFLGSSLAKRLHTIGHDITIVKRSSSSVKRISSVLQSISAFDIDICGTETIFRSSAKFDAIIHCATEYGRNTSSPYDVFRSNTVFPLDLISTGSRFGAIRFINTDTYFNVEGILCDYLGSYALSKRHTAEWGKLLTETGVNFVNVKLQHIYGCDGDESKFTTNLIRKCLQNVQQIDLTGGAQKRDFVYINDVVEAYVKILECGGAVGNKYQQFDVGSGESISVKEFVLLVGQLANTLTQFNFGALPYRTNEIMDSKANIKALAELGWEPKVGLSQGIQEILDYETILNNCYPNI